MASSARRSHRTPPTTMASGARRSHRVRDVSHVAYPHWLRAHLCAARRPTGGRRAAPWRCAHRDAAPYGCAQAPTQRLPTVEDPEPRQEIMGQPTGNIEHIIQPSAAVCPPRSHSSPARVKLARIVWVSVGRALSAPADLTRPFGTVTRQIHGPGRHSIAPGASSAAVWGRAGGWWRPSAWRWTAPQLQASRSRTRSRCWSPPLSRAYTTPTSSSRRTTHAHATVGVHGQLCCIHWPGSAVRPRVAVASNARPTRD